MSQTPIVDVESPPTSAFSNVGGFIRQLRESRGLSISDVSARLKYSAAQINALEADDFSRLPQGAALRGMARNYARLLDADESAVLSMLDQQAGTAPMPAVARSADGSWVSADMPLYAEPKQRPWGWILIIAVLLLVVVFYALDRGWIPDSWLLFDWLKDLKQ
ncbi:helix-turn-helix domain-containing protein [Paenalcaligenes niemegkensis]|uniref:helix-turn-helix domain-containing protein n=1 Tax=Paenalcaligenes niemegkensis TaxID=2895469 RepID=UPI001EE7D17E|nr:helix-turn-helix domain-containing protein [Paenalcaligenes niemegkensis]MCQ9616731.1 helix-turn-helix domain-containing protein [Paenalcaligenes niemegkensis]